MYISLKEGWCPLSDLCIKYKKDKGNMNRVLERIDSYSKEKIGNVWVVREIDFVNCIKTDIIYENNREEQINRIVDLFTTELSKSLSVDIIKSKFMKNNITNGDYIIKTLSEISLKCKVTFPVVLYEYMEDEEYGTYTKSLLVIELWNKTLALGRNTDY